jgi:uncharacterized repeat protein (TIGR03803 family)
MRNARKAASLVAVAFCALAQATLTACGGNGNGSAPPQTQVLHSFGTEAPAFVSPTGLVLGTDGNFYGTALGGAYNGGVIFKITPAGVASVVHSFDPSTGDGEEPGPLILASDGNFYGTTVGGGTNGWGTVFKMTPNGTESVLYSFKGYPSDSAGASGVFQAGDGTLYGTSDFGGTYNKGTVFKVSPSGIETVLYSFGSAANDPARDVSALVEGDDGNFYGVSAFGGTSNLGAVFRITPEGILTLVHSFTGGSNDGVAGSGSGLLKGSDGNFYGIASGYGPNGAGIVYRLTPAGVETIVYAFGPSTSGGVGSFPEGTLSEDPDGNLYGGTQDGGYPRTVCGDHGCTNTGSSGTIFEITAAGNAVLLSNFGPSAADGTNPSGPPIQGPDGSLYGVTINGGADDGGVFYKITQ